MNHQADNSDQPRTFAKAAGKIALYLNLVVGLGLIVVHAIQNDWLAPITMIPTWMWLIPAGILLLISRSVLTRKLVVVTLLVWLSFVILFAEEARSLVRFRSLPEQTSNSQTVRIATLNCNIGSRNAALELMQYSPDIVLLQESPNEKTLAEIGNELFGQDAQYATTGDASIIANGKLQLINPSNTSHFCHAVVTLADGRQTDIVSLRLSPPVFLVDFLSSKFWKDHHQTRVTHREQLQAIVDHLNQSARTDCWIIGGDFNLVGGDGSLSPLDSFQDTFHQSGSGWCNTGTSDYPLFRVDQIWVKGKVRSTVNKTFRTIHSDHRAVVTDLIEFGE